MQPTLSDRPSSCHDNDSDTAGKFCILGAGSSGLTVAKNFRERGIPYDCLEREDDVGGNWYFGKSASSVYRSTRLISSKPLTEYTDFPMPEHYPDHPDQDDGLALSAQLRRALRSISEYPVQYERASLEPVAAVAASATASTSGWDVTLESGKRRRYRGVVIANGHNWDPRWPNYPGQFDGLVLHSSQYKTPDVLVGRRVLGGGRRQLRVRHRDGERPPCRRDVSQPAPRLRRFAAVLPRPAGRPVRRVDAALAAAVVAAAVVGRASLPARLAAATSSPGRPCVLCIASGHQFALAARRSARERLR